MGELKLGLFLVILLVVLGGLVFVSADNETNGTNTTVVNDSSNDIVDDNVACSEDSDCSEGYECEDGICIIEVSEENNETDVEDNETETNETEVNETVVKVCCKRTRLKEGKAPWFNYIEEGDCVSSGGFDAEIVEDTMCKRFRYQLNNTNETECPQNCSCTGSVTKCRVGEGREMTVRAGNSGNTIVQVKGVEMKTQVQLYKGEDGEYYGEFDGVEKKIKFFPDQVEEKIKEKIRAHVYSEDTEIELDEDGEYRVQTKKRAKLFGFIGIKERVNAKVDPETGEVLQIRNSWWGFLASDIGDLN